MLTKWFKRQSPPTNGGKKSSSELEKLQYLKVFELELSNMEDTPVYELKHQLSVGSEIGNIVVSDPSVSPRHASFILQQDVVSVIDHGSISGTFVSGKKIPPGKYIILEETDQVNVGDLEIRLRVSTVSAPLEPIPEIPRDEVPQIALEEVAPPPKKTFDAREHLKHNTKKVSKKTFAIQRHTSANALVRVFAVLSDLLLSYSLLIVFLPFDDFRHFLDFIPSFVGEALDVDWSVLWQTLTEDYPFLGKMGAESFEFLSSTFKVLPLLLVFILLRLMSTLVLGVSISEYCLGMRGFGNGLWARVGGVGRVFIGVVTWPFLIFDFPSIISRRTLKEFLTFTRTTVPSKFLAILGIILYVPLLVVLALLAPLVQGLEGPAPIAVNDKIDKRIRVTPTQEGQTEVLDLPFKDQAQSLKMELSYNPSELLIVPSFRFQGAKSKLSFKTGAVFYQKDLQNAVELELYKKFDLKQLLRLAFKGNFFLFDKYPILYNYAYSEANTNSSFRPSVEEKSQELFAQEFVRFTKMAFSLSLDNALQVMEEETFLLKGLVDYKSSFLSLIEYKDFDQIQFVKVGNTFFLKMSFHFQKPFDLIIPLTKDEGRIYKVSFDKKENLNAASTKFYKFNLEKSNWLPELSKLDREEMTSLKVIDLFSTDKFKQELVENQKAQALYGYYYETSAEVIKKADPVELEIWKTKVSSLPALLESLPTLNDLESGENAKEKLIQNFTDLIDALENKNSEYFGISQTTIL